MRLVPIAGLVLLAALAACQRPPARNAEQAKTATPPAAAAHNAERRPGLWEQRVSDGQGVQVSRVCLDASTDRQLSLFGRQMSESQCQEHTVARQPNGGWRIATVCDMGSGGRVSTTGVATGDFTRSYQIRFETTTTGAALDQMNGQHRLIVDAAFKGPCPAGMAPGDMELPGGTRVRALDISRPEAGH
jgi:hypothetical protein